MVLEKTSYKIFIYRESFYHYLSHLGEGDSTIKTLTFAELRESVRRYRAALKRAGVIKGDRVVGENKKNTLSTS